MRIAVIGSGISGLGFAYLAHQQHDVRIFEKSHRIGGHAHTHTLNTEIGNIAVDTGFIVYNELNYPNLTGMFSHLDIETIASDMSLSVAVDNGKIEYEGTLGGLFAKKTNILKPRFWRMLAGLVSFYRTAYSQMQAGDDDETLGQFIHRCGYNRDFVNDHLLPMGGAIWSCPAEVMLDYPVKSFIQFLENHRLMDFTGRPVWRTVAGGSQQYVTKIAAILGNRLQTNTQITRIRREGAGVILTIEGEGEIWFDKLVMAAHADQSLALLSDATHQEQAILSSFQFSDNHVYLHSDPTLMPTSKRAWASWNYSAEADGRLSVTYWMNRLQSLDARKQLFVSLNPANKPRDEHIFAEADYQHPIFNLSAIKAQRNLASIQGTDNIYYCGAWTANGFHEDGLKSAVSTALSLDIDVPWQTPTRHWHQPDTITSAYSA